MPNIDYQLPDIDLLSVPPPSESETAAGSSRKTVYLRSVMESEAWKSCRAEIPIVLGETRDNSVPVVGDLATAPHILIGGTTGSGKSVLMNSIITGLLFKFSPDELKFILIDPKRVEFYDFRDLPHLLTPVITDATRAAGALRWTVGEIDRRFERMGEAGVKNIREYNDARGDDEKKLPRIVVIIDELAYLMMATETAREDIENSICRIAQIGRAAGVHLIVSTVRPSSGGITDVIRLNFPTRIAFRVLRKEDSQAILDQSGAEKLLGMGDMLVRWPAGSSFERTQGAYIPDRDLKRLVAFVNRQAKPPCEPIFS